MYFCNSLYYHMIFVNDRNDLQSLVLSDCQNLNCQYNSIANDLLKHANISAKIDVDTKNTLSNQYYNCYANNNVYTIGYSWHARKKRWQVTRYRQDRKLGPDSDEIYVNNPCS